MGIGTSLGAYYEDAFQHQSDVHEEIKPKEDIDNNVVTPPEVRQNKEMDKIEETELGGTPVQYKTMQDRIYVSPNRDDIGKAPFGVGGPAEVGNDQAETLDNIVTKLGGSEGERYQMWPERMFRQAFDTFKKGMDGGIPGYVMDPETGDFHTSPEMMDAAHDMMPLAMSGTMPATVHLRGPVAEAITGVTPETRTAAQDAISSIRRSSNYSDQHVERLSNPYRYDPEATARGMQSSDPTERAIASIEHALYGDPSTTHLDYHREAFHSAEEARRAANAYEFNQTIEARPLTDEQIASDVARRETRTRVSEEVKEAAKNDKLSLIDNGKTSGYESTSHNFLFANKAGKGELSITESGEGKNLYVNGIYGDKGPWQYDTRTIKDLVKLLKNEFPNAETLSGFRVSGARAATGSGPARASMRLRKPYDHAAHTKYREEQ